jgi:hypothetical protein
MDFDPKFANELYALPLEPLRTLDKAAELVQVREPASLTTNACPSPLFSYTLFCLVEGYDQGIG